MCKLLESTSRGEDCFDTLKELYQNERIDFRKLIGSTTDGAQAIVGRHSSFQTLEKRVTPESIAVHCWIHREALTSKMLPNLLHKKLLIIIKMVNYV